MAYFRQYIIYICIGALTMATSGCSVYDKIMGKKSEKTTVSGAQATQVKQNEPAQSSSAAKPAASPAASDRTDKAKQVAQSADASTNREMAPVFVMPAPIAKTDTMRQPDAYPTTTLPLRPGDVKVEVEKPVMPDDISVTHMSEMARVVGGSWTIVQVGTTAIDRDEDMPYIVFVPGEGSFYANNGCNTLNGTYAVSGDRISFHNVLTTLRLCPEVTFDHEINTIICDESENQLRVSEVGSETILEFVTSTGKTLMRLRRGNLEFLNGQWEITAVAGLESLKEPATVFFDLTDMKLHGNTGCNFINGEIYLDHRMANAVDFSNIITTLRACLYPEQQTAILVGLEETVAAISDGADKVILLGPESKILLELKRAEIVR